MRVIVSVQSKRGSSRGLVHYIAHSKVDTLTEEPKGRSLFNDRADNLDVTRANKSLKRGISDKRPTNDELHHIVLSIRPEDYRGLGADEQQRAASLREIVRSAFVRLGDRVGAESLSWAASIHRNTRNPHVHIALQKEYFDRGAHRHQLTRIPSDCLPHYSQENGERVLLPGELIAAAVIKMDEIVLEKNKQTGLTRRIEATPSGAEGEERILPPEAGSDRSVLANAILADYYLERSTEKLNTILLNGRKKRFVVQDPVTGRKLRMSLDDIERRAGEAADRELRATKIKDESRIAEYRHELLEAQMSRNSPAIRRIRAIILKTAATEESRRLECRTRRDLIRPEANRIRRDHRRKDLKLPPPALTKDEIDLVQEHSLESGRTRTAMYLERVRRELEDRGEIGRRTPRDILRIQAAKVVHELRSGMLRQRLASFDDRRYKTRFDIHGGSWSIASIERLPDEDKGHRSKSIGKLRNFFGSNATSPGAPQTFEKAELQREIGERIERERSVLERELVREIKAAAALELICRSQTIPEIETMAPAFSAEHLAEIESLSLKLRLPDVYVQNWEAQKELVRRSAADTRRPDSGPEPEPAANPRLSPDAFVAGRAIAHETIAGLEVERAAAALKDFRKFGRFHKFALKDEAGGETRYISLADADIRRTGSIFDQALEYIVEGRERRQTRRLLRSMVKAKEDVMKKDLVAISELHRFAGEEAAPFKVAAHFSGDKTVHAPIFTAGERAAIERFIEKDNSLRLAAPLKRLLELSKDPVSPTLSNMLGAFTPAEMTRDQRETEIARLRFGPEELTPAAPTSLDKAAPIDKLSHDQGIALPRSSEQPRPSRGPAERADGDRTAR